MHTVAIIGAGPAGLIAADMLSAAGVGVHLYERMPSVGRKFLMAGRGGLNLTHSEPLAEFLTRYGPARDRLAPLIDAFNREHLIAWCEALGEPTFIGSSGRVFPKSMKASPLLRAWLARLAAQGVTLRTRATWRGWDASGALQFDGAESIMPDATLLALGGASWPKLGSDGAWAPLLQERGVALAPFKPANVGFDIAWSDHFRDRFAGQPLKGIALSFQTHSVRGEAMIARYGLEGGAIYALSAPLRDALERQAPQTLHVDLRPQLSHADIEAKLTRAKRGDSLSSTLRKALNLAPMAINLLREAGPLPNDPAQLAQRIKAVPLTLTAPHGLARAISTAGGVAWDAVDDTLQLRAIANTYVAGEMLDWEAPTGGYLLHACFATGAAAARAILESR
jgi:uncharacterized flavoprotein (TIGR03862 family)